MKKAELDDTIVIDLKNVIVSHGYKVRRSGQRLGSFEATIPLDAYEREARRRGLTTDEFMERYEAIWRYGEFDGLYLTFELREGRPGVTAA
jgi:hypothetical protein